MKHIKLELEKQGRDSRQQRRVSRLLRDLSARLPIRALVQKAIKAHSRCLKKCVTIERQRLVNFRSNEFLQKGKC